ncbi:hypothetical protein TRVL_03428 [Trypanosoma vivax]|nr:hypothetical protein TRVL_03428 [Trypanosoma vivax]
MAGSVVNTLPNLCALVGCEVTRKLVERAGSVAALARLSDAGLRHAGSEASTSPHHADSLYACFLSGAPVFVDFFGTDAARADSLQAARKGLAVLARKCHLAIKADVSDHSGDCTFGEEELKKVKRSFETLLIEGKVNCTDTQALPVPDVFVRGEKTKKRRAGWKELRKQQAQKDAPNALERAVSYVKMGVSEEEQLQAIMQRSDLQAEVLKTIKKAPEQRKRPRGDDDGEYDDLLQIKL